LENKQNNNMFILIFLHFIFLCRIPFCSDRQSFLILSKLLDMKFDVKKKLHVTVKNNDIDLNYYYNLEFGKSKMLAKQYNRYVVVNKK